MFKVRNEPKLAGLKRHHIPDSAAPTSIRLGTQPPPPHSALGKTVVSRAAS